MWDCRQDARNLGFKNVPFPKYGLGIGKYTINSDENVWAENLQFLTGLNFVISVGEKLNKLENLNDRLSSRQTGRDDDG